MSLGLTMDDAFRWHPTTSASDSDVWSQVLVATPEL